jgi:hypothetical protein
MKLKWSFQGWPPKGRGACGRLTTPLDTPCHADLPTFDDVHPGELVADGSLDVGLFVYEGSDVEASFFVHFANGARHRRLVLVHLDGWMDG